jgi:hypothetical protein
LALVVPASAVAGAPVIVLDPGHRGASLTTIDPETQISEEEYANSPEITNVFDVAIRLKAKLEAIGNMVLMTKQNATALYASTPLGSASAATERCTFRLSPPAERMCPAGRSTSPMVRPLRCRPSTGSCY